MAGEFISVISAVGEELKNDRDEHFEPPYTTLQANMVNGGTAVNVLARDANVVWEYRALPNRDVDKAVSRSNLSGGGGQWLACRRYHVASGSGILCGRDGRIR